MIDYRVIIYFFTFIGYLGFGITMVWLGETKEARDQGAQCLIDHPLSEPMPAPITIKVHEDGDR